MDISDIMKHINSGEDINYRYPNGWTLLHFAAEQGIPEAVALLASKGADLNIKCNQGWTPLHLAVDSDIDGAIQTERPVTLDTAEALIKAGASEDACTSKGETPRDIAAAYGQRALDMYDKISRKTPLGQPTLQEFACDCCNIIKSAGYDILLLDGNQISVAGDPTGHRKPWYHFYISAGTWYARRRDPRFGEELKNCIREGFVRLKKQREG